MSKFLAHPYHITHESPWPVLSSLSAMALMVGLVQLFCVSQIKLMIFSLISLVVCSYMWWLDISSESSMMGIHTSFVELGLRWGMILFIISEIFFFLSFFWAFFHSSIAPAIEIGGIWPPKGILVFNPLEIPFLNTLILLSSGVTVTYAHHSMMSGNHKETLTGLFFTIILGIYFTFLQGLEYMDSSFNISDSSYGASFFIATGFHGLHVLVGTLFLMVCFYRSKNFVFSSNHHFGMEASAWYWHFVDVVWLFLYISIYWWGGMEYC